MLKTFNLKNGMHIATYDMPELRSVNLTITVKGGSIVEPKHQEGVAHFMEHMLVQGIPSFPNAQALSGYAEGLAGSYGAYTSQNTVAFTMTVPFSHIRDALRIGSEVFFEPLFPVEAFEKERRAVLNEIDQDTDSRWYKFQEFSRKIRYVPTSVFQQKTVGKKQIIEQVTHEDLVGYWKSYFVPSNTYLFVCGNLSKIDVGQLLEEYFGKHESPKKFPGFPKLSRDDLAGRQVAIRNDRDLHVNYLDLTFPALSYYDRMDLKIKQDLALTILGGLRTSRLFQLLRYQKGLVYNVSANDFLGLGVGTAYIYSEVTTSHLDEVVELIVKEFHSFREKGPLEKELAFTKNYLSNKWLMSFDHPSAIGDWVNGEFLWKDSVHMPEDYISMMRDIEVGDVVELMQEYWDMKKLQLVIQGPVEDSKENISKFDEMIEVLR
jgi:predicted Zn-dependent peptidase